MELNEYLALQNKRRRPHAQEESKIQMSLVLWLKVNHPNVLFTSTLGGIRMNIGQAVKLKRLGYCKGIPDLVIFEPRGLYHGLLIELKTPSGTVSRDQEDVEVLLRHRGYLVIFCYGLDPAIRAIERYLNLKLGEA